MVRKSDDVAKIKSSSISWMRKQSAKIRKIRLRSEISSFKNGEKISKDRKVGREGDSLIEALTEDEEDIASDGNTPDFDIDEIDSDCERMRSNYTCHVCNVSFKLGGLYNKHMVKHSDLQPFKCKICDRKFKYNSGLKKHVREQHDETAPLYNCKICEFSTKHYPYLQEHFTRKHTDDYKYKCAFCKKQFKVETDYKIHVADHEIGLCVCDVCGLTYPNKSSLYYHRNYKHTKKNKSFECEICKKKLHNEKNLKIHLQQHDETYVCEECGMKFARKYGLTKHRRVHTREKSHLCPVCGKAFACMATQRVHFLTHAGVRPYICNVCGSKFTQRSSLMLHWKKKHPEASDPPPPVTLTNILETIKLNLD